jgi:cardiolipin synthase A/B
MDIPHPIIGSYPVRTGNAVRPLVDGAPAFRRIGEVIDRARHSVWLTVAFYTPDFRMPDGRGSLFDVLDRAVARGLDVRVIFWRPNPESPWGSKGSTFEGTSADHNLLQTRGSTFRARWDRAHGHYLHHQKSWLIDAGQPSEVAFVGGINLTARATGAPGHAEGHRHDAYVEVIGPAATDVHHNFVQRWNEATERTLDDGKRGHDAGDQLVFPTRLSDPRGKSVVQIQRNVHAGRYADGRASPGGLHTTLPMASGLSSTNTYSLSARPKKPSTSRTKPFRSRQLPTRLKRRLNEGSRSSFWFRHSPNPTSAKHDATRLGDCSLTGWEASVSTSDFRWSVLPR